MDWKQIGINLLVMAVVYTVFYSSSYFFSRMFAEKNKKEEKEEKDEKQK